jgi:hypothetical protein
MDKMGQVTRVALTMLTAKKRPIGRKQAEEKMKSGVDDGPYKQVLQNLILEKEKIKEEMRGEEDDTRAQGITGGAQGGGRSKQGSEVDVGRTKDHIL